MKLSLDLQLPLLLIVAATCQAATRKLLVGSHSGRLTTLNFDTVAGTLTQSSVNTQSGSVPGWQTLFKGPYGKKFILSTNEVWDGVRDAIVVLSVDSNGALSMVSKSAPGTVVTGPIAIGATRSGLVISAS